ncbi:MAG TPA: MFS transporter [Bryobacteraceae bacterium]|nr:MFS transporter [Bryobacteraceae bacterium]
MSLKEFRRAGHAPTLASAFLYFDVSFMVWVILGPLGPFLGESLKLSASQKGFLTAVPLLGGSIFRLLLGWMTERIGARRTGLIGRAHGRSSLRRLALDCRWPAPGIRPNTKASPWVSPVPATPAPCWPRSSLRGWPKHSDGIACSASP